MHGNSTVPLQRRGRPSPGSRTRFVRVTVSIRLEHSEFTEKYSFIILATSICCYFIQSSIVKLDWF
jgi:hypothetical protein